MSRAVLLVFLSRQPARSCTRFSEETDSLRPPTSLGANKVKPYLVNYPDETGEQVQEDEIPLESSFKVSFWLVCTARLSSTHGIFQKNVGSTKHVAKTHEVKVQDDLQGELKIWVIVGGVVPDLVENYGLYDFRDDQASVEHRHQHDAHYAPYGPLDLGWKDIIPSDKEDDEATRRHDEDHILLLSGQRSLDGVGDAIYGFVLGGFRTETQTPCFEDVQIIPPDPRPPPLLATH
ncbi:MAG: hypothetical protein Q9184_007317 [Pyrenodesmia sp. 2 TL-2023]